MKVTRTFVVEKESKSLGLHSVCVEVEFDVESSPVFGDFRAERVGRCVDAAIEAFKKEWTK